MPRTPPEARYRVPRPVLRTDHVLEDWFEALEAPLRGRHGLESTVIRRNMELGRLDGEMQQPEFAGATDV